ncbi:DnaJ domain-containing protein [Pontibacter sp. 13R65]|uniref:DnaJ domain-containing protein n=1 Tax=Pontibacter sp. 13R65 TaxID=3127458 RepID=UPI00301BF6BD
MRTAIKCPHCEKNTIESLSKVWFVYGFLIFAKYGKRTILGCKSCLINKIWSNFFICLLGGWWCFPWGLGTPIVLIQNIIILIFPYSKEREHSELYSILDDAGIDISDVEVDEQGLTVKQRAMIERLVLLLKEAINADSVSHPDEIAHAVQIIISLTANALSKEQALQMLNQVSVTKPQFENVNYEERITLLEMVISVCAADGVFNNFERLFLNEVGKRLAFPPSFVDLKIRQIIYGENELDESIDDELKLARMTLGVNSRTSFAEVKRKYKELIVVYHPDVANNNKIGKSQAEEITKQLTWAYQILRKEMIPVEAI